LCQSCDLAREAAYRRFSLDGVVATLLSPAAIEIMSLMREKRPVHEKLEDEIQRVLAGMDNQENHEPETERPAEETASSTRASEEIQDIYVLIVREQEPESEDKQVVESVESDEGDKAAGTTVTDASGIE